MKKQLLTVLAAGIATTALQAQPVTDSVLMGAGYANQVWYSLANDEQGNSPKNNWDLAFDGIAITSSIHINTPGGAKLWVYPKGNKTAYGTALDTNGLSALGERYNSPYWWELGAMGNYADPANNLDLDWGSYDMSTHIVSGDSVYIIKLTTGDYKQLFIEKLTGGIFYLKLADIDGSNQENVQVDKTQFKTKNLGYYSISSKAMVNREPDKDKWDITFTQYTDMVMGMHYPVTGVLINRHHSVQVAQADKQANAASYNGWQVHTFDSVINMIGYDWKAYQGGSYVTKDSTVYFVAVGNPNGFDIWRLYFTGFSSADGKSVFQKEKIRGSSISDMTGNSTTLAVYPNPSNGGPVQVAYNIEGYNNNTMLTIIDLTGKTVLVQALNNNPGMYTFTIPANTLRSGMYIVSVSNVGGRAQQKLMIN